MSKNAGPVAVTSKADNAPKNISVFLRVRPPIAREKNHTFQCIQLDPQDPQVIRVNKNNATTNSNNTTNKNNNNNNNNTALKTFNFNRVFPSNVTQQTVFQFYARRAVRAAMSGEHGVLFVYGQTGSGKTFTLSNEDKDKPGMLQQAMKMIWSRIAKSQGKGDIFNNNNNNNNNNKSNKVTKGVENEDGEDDDDQYEYRCSVSYVQLYNEILTDLLDGKNGRVRIQMGPEGRGDVVLVTEGSGNAIERPVNSYEETMKLFQTGMNSKEMASTTMNATSSRSHTVFTLNIVKYNKIKNVSSDANNENNVTKPVMALEGRLVVCDLAGSERISKTLAEGKTIDEAKHINGSLLVLGKVVAALIDKNHQHAPFRESKLTRILQYSLLGNGNTSIIINISPSDDNIDESLSAIQFGQRAIQIKQDSRQHAVLDYKALYLQLMAELDAKRDQTLEGTLAEEGAIYENRIRALQDQLKLLQEENAILKNENTALRSGVPNAILSSCTGGSGSDWKKVNHELRQLLTARDEELAKIGSERIRLALLLADEQQKTIRLGLRMRQMMVGYEVKTREQEQRTNELQTELAMAKGMEYLSTLAPMDTAESAFSQKNSYVDPEELRSVTGGGFNEDGYLSEQLERAHARIRSLMQERAELLMYQAKADKAIRLLCARPESGAVKK